MAPYQTAYRGCLLGLAVGDAMGYPIDSMSWKDIQKKYGANGLMGYDLMNGYADVTSYTQLAAFTCNGLLLALTRGQMMGKMAPWVKYVGLSSREWVASQQRWGRPEVSFCWLLQQPELCRRRCMDTRMMDILSRRVQGSMDDPMNNFITPGSLTAAIGVGLFYNTNRMGQEELDRLGAEVVALSHDGALAFLSGAALAHIISRLLYEPEIPLKKLILETEQCIKRQFGHQYSQSYELCNLLHMVVSMGEDPTKTPVDIMEFLHCESAAQVLAGALYACMAGSEILDQSLIIAVNHSGRSSAVGAITGAILGLRQREEALPVFYLECLEPTEILQELADDLYHGCPMEMGSRLFDGDWDMKYVHGGR